MTDVTTSQGQDGAGLSAADERLLRELTERALQDAGIDRDASDQATSVARLPGMDMRLGLPADVVSIMSGMAPTGPIPGDRLQEAAERLVEALTGDIVRPDGVDPVYWEDHDS